MVISNPSWLVGAKMKCTMQVAPSKRPINQFEPVQQSSPQALRAYCPNIYTVAQERSLTLQIITATVVVVKQLELSSCFCTFSQNIYSVVSIKRAARLTVLRNFSNLLTILRSLLIKNCILIQFSCFIGMK